MVWLVRLVAEEMELVAIERSAREEQRKGGATFKVRGTETGADIYSGNNMKLQF